MKNFTAKLTTFLILICINTTFAQDAEHKDIEAKINLENKGRLLSIVGNAINNTSQEYQLRYELSVITGNKDHGNSSQNKQSGSFLLPSSTTKTLSKTSISQNPGNQAKIKLQILNENRILAKDSITFQF